MSNNPRVQSAFPIVVFGAVGLSILMSLVFLFTRGSLYDHIGDGGLAPAHLEVGRDAGRGRTQHARFLAREALRR